MERVEKKTSHTEDLLKFRDEYEREQIITK